MTFDDLKLLCAIHRQTPDGRDHTSDEERLEFALAVSRTYGLLHGDSFFPWSTDQVAKMRLAYRKSKSTQMKAKIALAHGGAHCFWRHRDKGACCESAEAGHLVPNCKGGPLSVANCIIECRAHNNQRRERTIEEYLWH
jgi:hypothetical protein